MRSVPEWKGRTDDESAPPRVRLRCFDREHGICYLSGIKIMPGMKWELHHSKALIRGGQNIESNLFPVLVEAHKGQTKLDKAFKKTVARKRSKHLGIKSRSHRPMQGSRGSLWKKKLDGTIERR